MKLRNQNGRGPWPLPRIALAVGVLTFPLAGCDTEELLEVEDPELATPEVLNTEAGVPVLVAQGLGDFQFGYSGGGTGFDSFISTTGLITDELYTSDTFPTRTVLDQRDLNPTASGNESDDAYQFLQLARRSLDAAADATEQFFGADDPRIARLRALEGFTYVALGEGFCSGIPFSTTTQVGAPDQFGEPIATAAVFDTAVARYNAALAVNAGYNLAAVGKARALVNQGKYQEAAAAVAAVPTTFVYMIEHSDNTTRQQNALQALQDNGRYSVSDEEGINGLPFRSALDPRVPWVEDPEGGFDANIPLFINLRYPNQGSDVPLATGVEARLIEAEAALNAGDVATWLAKLNELRADVFPLMALMFDEYELSLDRAREEAGEEGFEQLAPLTDPGTRQGRLDLLFAERGFWLYTTGHRLGDLRRLVRNYNFPKDEAFPTGAFFKGGEYGSDVAFPITFEEVNNPNFDLASCNTTEA